MLSFLKFELSINICYDFFFFFFWAASARSYKIVVVGNTWLVGNAVFSETAQRIFLIFCMKLGDHKGRKITEPEF